MDVWEWLSPVKLTYTVYNVWFKIDLWLPAVNVAILFSSATDLYIQQMNISIDDDYNIVETKVGRSISQFCVLV
jgi:hypothetical protein